MLHVVQINWDGQVFGALEEWPELAMAAEGLAVRMLFHSVDFVEYDRAKAVISRPFHFANRRADILQRNQSRAEDSSRELIH
jgi:hypothetical protein